MNTYLSPEQNTFTDPAQSLKSVMMLYLWIIAESFLPVKISQMSDSELSTMTSNTIKKIHQPYLFIWVFVVGFGFFGVVSFIFYHWIARKSLNNCCQMEVWILISKEWFLHLKKSFWCAIVSVSNCVWLTQNMSSSY